MNRPTGVTIIGVLSIIGGILGICAGAAGIGLGGILGVGGAAAAVGVGSAEAAAVAGASGLLVVFSFVSLVISIVQLAGGVGLLQLAPWAYRLTVIITIVSIIIAVLGVVLGGNAITSIIISVAISGVILWYMNQPEVRSAFNRGDKQLWAA